MRVEIPVSITSTVVNGVPVFVTEGPRSCDSDWPVFLAHVAVGRERQCEVFEVELPESSRSRQMHLFFLQADGAATETP